MALVTTRSDFLRRITGLGLTHTDCAIALLWYYAYTQEYEERTPSELASDLHDEGFPRPNVTRLAKGLRRSRLVVRGARKGTFQLDVRRRGALDEKYLKLLNIKVVEVSALVLEAGLVAGTRGYLERLVHQINGTYEYGFYDATAVLSRRLMESLLVEIYIHEGRSAEIRQDGAFLQLERLIAHVRQDTKVTLSRNAPRTMTEIKQLGDTAAHDRVYVTRQSDIDDVRPRLRRLIQELLVLAGINT